MQKEIKHTFFFPHPVEMVWDHLTRSELLAQWLMENDIQPVVGHKFQFRAKPAVEIEFDGIVYCEILEVIPLKKLSYSWKCSPTDSGHKINTIVVWTLASKDNGTELSLHQAGFKEKEYELFYLAMKNGWITQVEKLSKKLNSNVK
jgi:uncharacterized protein YndB with AHSA1/START domain